MQPDYFSIAERFGTPLYVYDETKLREFAQNTLVFQAPFGLTVRYAMKANPNQNILRLFNSMGIQIDASSAYEALRALAIGIEGKQILLTTQEPPKPEMLKQLVDQGVEFNACSLHQLELYGSLFENSSVSLRINPGEGSGEYAKTNVGGKDSSFGIWHERIPDAKLILKKFGLRVKRIHTHIGAGTDPEAWLKVLEFSLPLLLEFPEAEILNMGGGFKVARIPSEKTADLEVISARVALALEKFFEETGRKIRLEIEPGTYLTANTGSLLSTIVDKLDTGKDGHEFLKLDCGMTEILRPSYYGAQHTMQVISKNPSTTKKSYVVVGHCCESGDLLTPQANKGDELGPRELPEANIGDLFLIEGCGAYCASMSALHYNSYPEAAEALIQENGEVKLIRKREELQELLRNELVIREQKS